MTAFMTTLKLFYGFITEELFWFSNQIASNIRRGYLCLRLFFSAKRDQTSPGGDSSHYLRCCCSSPCRWLWHTSVHFPETVSERMTSSSVFWIHRTPLRWAQVERRCSPTCYLRRLLYVKAALWCSRPRGGIIICSGFSAAAIFPTPRISCNLIKKWRVLIWDKYSDQWCSYETSCCLISFKCYLIFVTIHAVVSWYCVIHSIVIKRKYFFLL